MAKGKYEYWLTTDGLLLLEAWARDGLTLAQIAAKCDVTSETLRQWRIQYPAMSAALKKGQEVVDVEVENALLKRALGYEYNEVMTEQSEDGAVKRRVTRKMVIPDVTAQIFWLKNRRPDVWRDRPKDESEAEALAKAAELLVGVKFGTDAEAD